MKIKHNIIIEWLG